MIRVAWQGRMSSLTAPSFSASSDFVLMLTSTAGRLGVPVHEALRRTQIPETALSRRGVPISLLAARQAWSSISAASGDPVFGLRIAEQLEVGGLDLLDFVTRSSATWGDAVKRFVRYAPLVAQAGTMSVVVEGDRVRFRHQVHGGLRIVSEMILGLFLRRSRQFSGEPLRPLSVRFMHRNRVKSPEYERMFDAPVRFDAECDELVFSRDTLDLPFRTAEPRLAELLDYCAESRLVELQVTPPVVASSASDVRAVLRACLAEGNANLDRVAERLNVSQRSLQRHLRELGTSHRALLREERELLSRELMARESPSHADLAKALGYSSRRSVARSLARRAMSDRLA
jgi:AraC-like DNA-binding protein